MNKPIYQMSTVGNCPRTLAARRLGYEPTPQSPEDIAQLNHYSRLEAVAAQQIADMGYKVEPSSKCQVCEERYGTERLGIHVEIDTPLYLLVGHLDRRLILGSIFNLNLIYNKLPIEIKSLGKSSWLKFQKEQFSGFTSYAGQECVYLEAEKSPGIYWVMERDSGKALKYVVNDFNNALKLDDFERITLPITFDQIEDKLNLIELSVQENQLPEGEESDNCWFCRYRYLCIKTEDKKLKVEESPILIEAAESYKTALELEKQAEEMKSVAKDTLLLHSKQNKVDKYRVSGVSFSYHGQKTKTWLDDKVVKEAAPDIYRLALKESKPFDSYTIRILKEKEG